MISVGPKSNPFIPRHTLWGLAAGLALLGWLPPTPIRAQTNNTPQILFLHLKITNQTVSLVEAVTRPGVLKKPRDATGGDLYYELLSVTGESLWKANVADPCIGHLEYEEPPGSGNLKRKKIFRDEAEFTLRVPVVAKARQVHFYKFEPSAAGPKGEKGLTRKSLGTVLLP